MATRALRICGDIPRRPVAVMIALACALAGCHPAKAREVSAAGAQTGPLADGVLRVCADPNNLPFSNQRGEGFENRIADLVASDRHAKLEYTWWPQRRGFVRNTLDAGLCDVVIGIPAAFERARRTAPYYRSSYVFVTRRDRGIDIASLDDPRLRTLRIGVQLIGDDATNTPPAHALSARGIARNVVGYKVLGDYDSPNPPARIIDAVANGDVDVAIAWGPLAGYFAAHAPVPLDVRPVTPEVDVPFLPFAFDIAMGVRRGDDSLRAMLDDVLVRRRASIDSILRAYDVPRRDLTVADIRE